jgi:hypothetical protein
MSTTDSTKCDRLKVAAYVKDAMTIAKFTDDEIEDKNYDKRSSYTCPARGSVT